MSLTPVELYWQTHGQLTPLKADASKRRYFRLHTEDQSYIVADCSEDPDQFNVCKDQYDLFSMYNLPIPFIDHWHSDSHSYRIQDLGNAHLIDHASYFMDAYLLIDQMQNLSTPQHLIRYAKKLDEIPTLFETFFMPNQALASQKEYEKHQSDCWSFLHDVHQSIPETWCHGDFHSENIMLHDNKLYFIDYQDSLKGPVTLDYVSLMDDVRVFWVPEKREVVFNHWCTYLAKRYNVADEQMHLWLEATSIFRLLRILAVFYRLSQCENKHGYLKYIPRIKSMIVHLVSDIPELRSLCGWVQT